MVVGAERGAWTPPAASTTWPRSRSAASSTAWSCLDEAGRGRTTGAAVERHALGRQRRGPDRRARWRPQAWADAVGLVPVASFTVTKLRWLAEHEPDPAARAAAVCLPHDWLTWRLAARAVGLDALRTDRSDASGTGYWSAATGELPAGPARARRSAGRCACRRCSGPHDAGRRRRSAALVLGPGAGRQRRRGAGRRARGRATSSCRSAPPAWSAPLPTCRPPTPRAPSPASPTPPAASCRWSRTLNAARVLDAAARVLGVDHAELSRLALSAPPGADGLVLVPYLEGERTPNRPDATGAVHGLPLATATPAHLARAAVEGMLCGLADGLDALRRPGRRGRPGHPCRRRRPVRGGAHASRPPSSAARVVVPPPGEYVADGAARQAAWACRGPTSRRTGRRPGGVRALRGRPRAGGARALRRGTGS